MMAGRRDAGESSFLEVRLSSERQDMIDRVHLLAGIARRIAVSRAVHGVGREPSDLDESLLRQSGLSSTLIDARSAAIRAGKRGQRTTCTTSPRLSEPKKVLAAWRERRMQPCDCWRRLPW
jgi:hypothetical protein